jgi:hypothetical protein
MRQFEFDGKQITPKLTLEIADFPKTLRKQLRVVKRSPAKLYALFCIERQATADGKPIVHPVTKGWP